MIDTGNIKKEIQKSYGISDDFIKEIPVPVMRYAHPTEEHQFNAMKKLQTFVAGGLK